MQVGYYYYCYYYNYYYYYNFNVQLQICAMQLGWWTTELSLLALLVNNALTQSQLNNQGNIENSLVEQLCQKYTGHIMSFAFFGDDVSRNMTIL